MKARRTVERKRQMQLAENEVLVAAATAAAGAAALFGLHVRVARGVSFRHDAEAAGDDASDGLAGLGMLGER